MKNVFATDGLLLLLVADVVRLGRDQVDELGAAVQDQLPEKFKCLEMFSNKLNRLEPSLVVKVVNSNPDTLRDNRAIIMIIVKIIKK